MTGRRLEYSPRYFRRLEDISERIAAVNPAAAARLIERIRASVIRLAASLGIGRPGRVAETRELVISGTPYIVPYRVKGDTVQIITRAAQCPALAGPVPLNRRAGAASRDRLAPRPGHAG